MKYLKTDASRCELARDCERRCAQVYHKTDDTSFAAIRVEERPNRPPKLHVCTQCGVCLDVCPTYALRRNKLGVVIIDRKLCIGCFQCVGYCPEEAIWDHPDLPYPIKCVACGQCAKVCPHGALEVAEMHLAAAGQPAGA
jgi:carbon-monoxide dehydrogenase iron sulfur subunit